MSDKKKFLVSAALVFLGIECSFKDAFAQGAPAMSKMYGIVEISSNRVDLGFTQSEGEASLQANLGYGFGGQGRLGIEAASISFPEEDANVELRFLGEYSFVFGPNSDLRLRNDIVRYFSEDWRNKTVILADQNFYTYHVLICREDNFEGSKKYRNWFALRKDWTLSGALTLETALGYSIVDGFESFYDTLIGLRYPISTTIISLNSTFVSNSAQFNGQADPFVSFKVQAFF